MQPMYSHIIKRVGILRGKSFAVTCGNGLGTQAPSIAEHERTVNKVHVQSDVGSLVLSKHLQRSRPIIVDLSDALFFELFEFSLLSLGDLHHLWVVTVDPSPPVLG